MSESQQSKKQQQVQDQKKSLSNDKRFKNWDRIKLIQSIVELEKKNKRLSNRIMQFEPHKQKNLRVPIKQKTAKLFEEHYCKKFALKICYLGFTYDGMVLQTETNNTIEAFLFKAMFSLNLIENQIPNESYTRAGRTDKGVSAMGNVVSLYLRTSIKKSQQKQQQNTLNYCSMLNAILPEDIRVIGCQQVSPQFNSRYWCTQRSYKYFFTKNYLNIQKMQVGLNYLIGTHNFVNYCKMNLTNTVNFQRTIFKAEVIKVQDQFVNNDQRNSIYYFHFIGNSFLWHQIRFMSTILFLVGSGQEQPTIVRDLLDVKKFPRKPNYPLAPQFPLILEDCQYKQVKFSSTLNVIKDFYNDFNRIAMKRMVQMTLVINCMNMAKRQLLSSTKITQQYFQTTIQQNPQKLLTNKRKVLAIHKPSSKGIQQAISGLKGKRLELYQKKARKQEQYDKRKKEEKEKEANEEDQ